MKNHTLVIMAAGRGSRFGGFKQIEDIDGRGHRLIDYTVYDAAKIGFDKILFIINREIEAEFHKIGNTYAEKYGISTDYVIQSADMLPDGTAFSINRKKPWGTAQAVACLKGKISSPFALVNADDYYGRAAIEKIYRFISAEGLQCHDYAMVGYRLEATLSEHGGVSRGVCRINKGFLSEIRERNGIRRCDEGIFCEENEQKIKLSPDEVVSVNLWGFTPDIIDECESRFAAFLKEKTAPETESCEFYLPTVISSLIGEGRATVRVLESGSEWQGVTYRSDKERLSRLLLELTKRGEYPQNL